MPSQPGSRVTLKRQSETGKKSQDSASCGDSVEFLNIRATTQCVSILGWIPVLSEDQNLNQNLK